MALYLDTSALVKLFVNESGSDAVEKAIAGDPDVYLGWLAPHEFLSALTRRQRAGELSDQEVGQLRSEFDALLASPARLVPYSNVISQRALDLIAQYGAVGLRALDAFQLATGHEVKSATFGVADKVLAEIARKTGLTVALFG